MDGRVDHLVVVAPQNRDQLRICFDRDGVGEAEAPVAGGPVADIRPAIDQQAAAPIIAEDRLDVRLIRRARVEIPAPIMVVGRESEWNAIDDDLGEEAAKQRRDAAEDRRSATETQQFERASYGPCRGNCEPVSITMVFDCVERLGQAGTCCREFLNELEHNDRKAALESLFGAIPPAYTSGWRVFMGTSDQ